MTVKLLLAALLLSASAPPAGVQNSQTTDGLNSICEAGGDVWREGGTACHVKKSERLPAVAEPAPQGDGSAPPGWFEHHLGCRHWIAVGPTVDCVDDLSPQQIEALTARAPNDGSISGEDNPAEGDSCPMPPQWHDVVPANVICVHGRIMLLPGQNPQQTIVPAPPGCYQVISETNVKSIPCPTAASTQKLDADECARLLRPDLFKNAPYVDPGHIEPASPN